MERRWILWMLVGCAAASGLASGGVLYTTRELVAVGNLWTQTRCRWKAEQERYKNRLDEIDASDMSEAHKEFFRQKEARLHRAESQAIAQKRQQVQNVLIDEANARAAQGGHHATSDEIEATLGTPIDDPAHSGMKSDLDVEGGHRTARKVRDTLDEMGLGDIDVDDQAGTLTIGDDFEVTVHKAGIEPRVGEEFHHVKNQVDARNEEIYMSERMSKDAVTGKKQAARDYVEAQDHLKKAQEGRHSTSKQLVDDPDTMQSLAKSTGKTLEMGNVSDEELAGILERHNIKKTPKQFREDLARIKERRVTLKDPGEAGRIREASKEIFEITEARTYERAQQELDATKKQLDAAREQYKKLEAMADTPETRARRERLKKSIRERARRLHEELIDSRSKMRATKAANEEIALGYREKGYSTGGTDVPDGPDTPGKPGGPGGDGPGGKGPGGPKPGAPDAPDSPGWKSRLKSGAGKAADGFGAVMDIADIGNACRKLEEYQEGKAELKDVVRSVVDMTPVGGLVGAVEKTGTSASDYADARRGIKKANEDNMTAYLTQWELSLRRAGVSKAEAKKYVAQAVLSGNLDALTAKAERLRQQGKEVKIPKLIVEDGPGPDGGAWYMWENTKEMGIGMYEGAKSGIGYIVTAPGRVVEAFGERELAEATMDYNSKSAESDMKTRLFRSLLNGGVSRKKALAAVQYGGKLLKEASQEARVNLAKAREEAAKAEEKRQEQLRRIDACLQRITALRFLPVTLTTHPPSPVPIPANTPDDQEMELTATLGDDLPNAVERIRREIQSITGQAPNVTATYEFSLKAATLTKPGTWTIRLPARPDLYPIAARATIRTAGLTGELAPLNGTIRRTVRSTVLIKLAEETVSLPERIDYVNGEYEPITAKVVGARPDAKYFFHWTIGPETRTTEEPTFRYSARLADPKKAETLDVSVALCDAETGCVLDEASAKLHIAPLNATVLIVRRSSISNRKIWKRVTCDEVIKSPYPNVTREAAQKVMSEGWVKAQHTEGESWDPEAEEEYIYVGRPHGPFVCYDFDTCTMVEQTGTYRKGKKHGRWTRYETDLKGPLRPGSLSKVDYYVDGKRDGLCQSYIEGWLWGKVGYKAGKKHGETIYYSRKIPGGVKERYKYDMGKTLESMVWRSDTGVAYDPKTKTARQVTTWMKTASGPDGAYIEYYDENFVLKQREEMK